MASGTMSAYQPPRVFLRAANAAKPAVFGASMFDAIRCGGGSFGKKVVVPVGAAGEKSDSSRVGANRCAAWLELATASNAGTRSDGDTSVVVISPPPPPSRSSSPPPPPPRLEESGAKPPPPSSPSSFLLPFGRAAERPSVRSTVCPTVGLADLGWYDNRPRRAPHTKLGVVGVVLDDDGRVLLTRRSRRMRSFPSAWVLPGGGVELRETLVDGVVREVMEETGIKLDPTSVTPIAIWESAYPTSTERCVASIQEFENKTEEGGIRAHHLVVFFAARPLPLPAEELPLILQEEEVEAAAWLTPRQIHEALSHPLGGAKGTVAAVGTSIEGSAISIPLDDFAGIYPRDGRCIGIAQGSLFILDEMLRSGGGNEFVIPTVDDLTKGSNL